MALHIHTPLIESLPLSKACGARCWIKLDALQPSGSFKLRGIGAACEAYRARGARRFVSSSGGNAGIAVAYAGRQLGTPVTVVVPASTTQRARGLITELGAELVVHGATWQEANAFAQLLMGTEDAFLHPFDDPLLWSGHATLIEEIAAAGLTPDAVVLSVGGGGLLSGVAEGLRRTGMRDTCIVAVETEGAASYRAALQAGHPAELDRITSIATSLGAKQVCAQAVKVASERSVRSAVVSDGDAARACMQFLEDHRVLVEPACGAALAPGYAANAVLDGFKEIVFVACGGVTSTLDQVRGWSLSL
ncbi:MAG TPA: pyridoxal-phosphate dependent enzyme [Burkholderiaceae bacterium]|jgi:L-serine/L-threonine ammonia-lyase|nr:pyridoxal-phosphate dependent enzyme [Burkholderiaceae bacterium]